MRTARVTINNDNDKMVLKGKSYLFTSFDAAIAQSQKVTTNPQVLTLQSNNYRDQYYLACGDHWIANNNDRGRYYYGRNGKLIDLINDDPATKNWM